MSIQVDPIASPRIITVPEADGDSITIQSLANQIREWEHTLEGLAYDRLLHAEGKLDLGGDQYVVISARLLNAKVKFADRASPTVCKVSGGNLVAVDADDVAMYPIEPSTNVTVMLAQATTGAILGNDIPAITDSVWSEDMDNLVAANSVGKAMKKLLAKVKFMAIE